MKYVHTSYGVGRQQGLTGFDMADKPMFHRDGRTSWETGKPSGAQEVHFPIGPLEAQLGVLLAHTARESVQNTRKKTILRGEATIK